MEPIVLNELINTVGFPIAVCVMLFWNNRETVKSYERLLLEFKGAIDNNTKAMDNLRTGIKNNV